MTDPAALLVGTVYGQVTTVLEHLDPADLARPTRAAGWSVADLTFHLLLDAQRVLVTLATPDEGPVDIDAASYWSAFQPGLDPEGDARHAEYVRRSAAAYTGPYGVVRHWSDTAAAASRAVRSAPVDGLIRTQDHVLTVADFLSTVVVEATVHYLDLVVELDAAEVDPAALSHTRVVLERILTRPLPERWHGADAVLAGTGRRPLSDADRSDLGETVDRFPLLG